MKIIVEKTEVGTAWVIMVHDSGYREKLALFGAENTDGFGDRDRNFRFANTYAEFLAGGVQRYKQRLAEFTKKQR